jgi:Flp pilus assembly protein TadG
VKALASIRALLGRFRRDEQGATIMLVTVMIVAILGFAAMVTDSGAAYWNRRMLQNGVDGASLAGASQLARNFSQPVATPATATSQAYALDNGLATGEIVSNQVTTTFEPNDSVAVGASRLDNWGLRYLVGAGDTNIGAGATAVVVAVQPADVWPFGITAGTDCTAGCVMKTGSGGSFDGNFGLLCFQGNGCGTQDNIVPEIDNGYSGAVPTPTTAGSSNTPPTWNWGINTDTGNKMPSANAGVSQLLNLDANKACNNTGVAQSCASLYQSTQGLSGQFTILTETPDQTVCISDTRCPRVGIVPLIQQSWSTLNGNSPVTVVGFACFYLTNMTGNGGQTQIYGTFLSFCTVNPTAGGTSLFNVPLNSTGAVGIALWR